MVWQQIYDPLGNMFLSTLLASVPVVVMLAGLGFFHMKAHIAAGAGLVAALVIAIVVYGMPSEMAANAALYGGLTGLLPIGWIVLNIIFLHQLTEQNGSFKVLQDSIAGITEDRRLQLLLIAFAFGAFFEGAAGFGTPVAVTAAILIGLGFSPLAASGLSLIANTGVFYPFFGTLMGWLGVALTGSDTASNVLFGGMQKVAAEQLGLSPNLMGAANSSGGVMGKMIDAQSIVVASTATRWFNHEGDILRYVFFHSIALACLVGILVTLQAYVFPFTLMVVH